MLINKSNKNNGNTSSKKIFAHMNESVISKLFSSEITHQESSIYNYKQDIDSMRKEIEVLGDKLENDPTISNFLNFRDILSRLAKKVNNEAYRLVKFGGTPQNPRYFEIITVINHEADQLYNLIVQDNKKNMLITSKVIGIKGLVVDLIG